VSLGHPGNDSPNIPISVEWHEANQPHTAASTTIIDENCSMQLRVRLSRLDDASIESVTVTAA
jgi:hypothetical protein